MTEGLKARKVGNGGRMLRGLAGEATALVEHEAGVPDENQSVPRVRTTAQWVSQIDSVERLGTSSGVVVEVSLRLTQGDRTTSTRTTYFVQEDGT